MMCDVTHMYLLNRILYNSFTSARSGLLGTQLVVIARHSPRRLTEVPLMFFVAVDVEHVVHRRTVLVPLALTEQNKTKTFQS